LGELCFSQQLLNSGIIGAKSCVSSSTLFIHFKPKIKTKLISEGSTGLEFRALDTHHSSILVSMLPKNSAA
jgi:hypothetical protein